MFRPTFIGMGFWIIGGLLYGFKVLTWLMERDDEFEIYSIEQIWGLEWINEIPWYWAQTVVEKISTTNFFILTFVIGLAFIIFGMFRK